MEITVNIKCDALVEAVNRICEVICNTKALEVTAKEKAESTKSKAVEKSTELELREEKNDVEIPEKETAVKTEIKEETVKISPETARKALADLSKAKGKEVAKSIIESFGFTKFTEIPEEKYSELMKSIKEV